MEQYQDFTHIDHIHYNLFWLEKEVHYMAHLFPDPLTKVWQSHFITALRSLRHHVDKELNVEQTKIDKDTVKIVEAMEKYANEHGEYISQRDLQQATHLPRHIIDITLDELERNGIITTRKLKHRNKTTTILIKYNRSNNAN